MTDSVAIDGARSSGFARGLPFIAGCVLALLGFVPVGAGLVVVFIGHDTGLMGRTLTLSDMGFAAFLSTPFYGLAALILQRAAPHSLWRDSLFLTGTGLAAIAALLLAVQMVFALLVTVSVPFCLAGLPVPLGRWLSGCHMVAGPVLLTSGAGLLALMFTALRRGRRLRGRHG